MHLVLCTSSDYAARWAFRELLAFGLDSLELVTSEMLALSTGWEHSLGAEGVTTQFDLPDGRRVVSSEVRGVLNRLLGPPEMLVAQAVESDREYAQQELTALYLSWLYAIQAPVINRPTPQGLAGRWRHASEWAQAAHRAGLAVDTYRQSASDAPNKGYASFAPANIATETMIVLGGEAFGANVPGEVRESCRRLASLAETPLLGIDLYVEPDGGWRFASATPIPDLHIGGTALVSRLYHIFETGGQP